MIEISRVIDLIFNIKKMESNSAINSQITVNHDYVVRISARDSFADNKTDNEQK